jgi:hypothetical protein
MSQPRNFTTFRISRTRIDLYFACVRSLHQWTSVVEKLRALLDAGGDSVWGLLAGGLSKRGSAALQVQGHTKTLL